ncbi:MAG: LPS export ABC transporter permease LptG [Novosphingobium sp. 28-62-57]|uniref:LPS export ABC transporter permease LptG n=1 Tax=Novosphingobium sp. 28-62-57 TaxID=1970409 RepID=UPI000BDAD508|nr:LPS export ABC transporter permease LptG [Novosphingobium sp. 28-62-57]OYW49269.1 MAG: LPS export ABC transporter permease LptG [Novosphingobium sp. 12-62-10]OYZ09704.1 MAG: LPS export ABC transporter permease LptG [Novosphingobium sp. 28-62-57]OZA32453.1 MAG: LPS export ABC transporter permease LptG [Novosphingobium sp. 17-62-9]HQS68375.1 LPS export ABC transporter permease LptG [Novosphingobium sp.]
MQLELFPSRTLATYIGKMFALRIVAVLLMLVLVLQMLDLLGESGKVLAAPGNGQGQLLTYVSLRMPQLISRFLPYSVLLATIITLMTLNQNSEVIAMKAAGLSAHQVLAPLFLVAALTSAVTFAFNERVVTRATSTLKAWQNVQYGPIPLESGTKTNVWLQDGPNILFARTVAGEGQSMHMDGVSWYRRDPTGMVTEIVTAASATYANPGWKFRAPVLFDVQSARKAPLGRDETYAKSVEPVQVTISRVDADAESLSQLNTSLTAIREAGFRTTELEGKWWHKLAGPLSALLMPLLGAVAAFGLARSGHLFVRAVTGMALGFAYFVFDNAALAMGNFGAYPPFLAAWAPFVLFFLIGETVLIRTEE